MVSPRIFIRNVRLDIRSPHATERRQGFGPIIQSGILHKTLRRPMQGVNVDRHCRQGRLRCRYGVRIKRNDRSIPRHPPIIMFAKQIQARRGQRHGQYGKDAKEEIGTKDKPVIQNVIAHIEHLRCLCGDCQHGGRAGGQPQIALVIRARRQRRTAPLAPPNR